MSATSTVTKKTNASATSTTATTSILFSALSSFYFKATTAGWNPFSVEGRSMLTMGVRAPSAQPKPKRVRKTNNAAYAVKMNAPFRYWMATVWMTNIQPDQMDWGTIRPSAMAFQLEKCPKTHRYHFQCYFQFPTRVCLRELLKIWPEQKETFKETINEAGEKINEKIMTGAWWEPRAGDHEQALAYCNKNLKDGHEEGGAVMTIDVESGEKKPMCRVNTGGWDEDVLQQQAQDQDVAMGTKIKEGLHAKVGRMAREHKSIKEMVREDPRCASVIGQAKLILLKSCFEDVRMWPMEVIVLTGPTGCGKTSWVYKKFGGENAGDNIFKVPPPAPGQPQNFMGYFTQDTILIDEIEESNFQWEWLLQLMDRYPFIVNVKGSSAPILSTRICITCNKHPPDWFAHTPNASFDTLRRRITLALRFFVFESDPKRNWHMVEMPEWEQVPQEREVDIIRYREELAKRDNAFVSIGDENDFKERYVMHQEESNEDGLLSASQAEKENDKQ